MRRTFINTLAPAVMAIAFGWLPFHSAEAGPIVNGDFADPVDLAGWTPTLGASIGEPTGAFAQLETDGHWPSTLEQTVTLPTAPAQLVFDFAFSTSLPALNVIPPGVFPDSLAVALVTSLGDWLDILIVDASGVISDPSDGIEALTGALPITVEEDLSITIPGFVPFSGGIDFSGRIRLLLPAAVRGQDATLYFDLYDEPDEAMTWVAIDNIAIEPVAVPAPATLGLMLIGLVGVSVTRRRNLRSRSPARLCSESDIGQ